MGKIEGSSISSKEMMENLNFIHQSKEDAKQYEWLYQCTNLKSLLSILESREIWLTNLKLVNDKEEVKRINIPKYEKDYFVACFTYADDIPQEHWEEYCNGEPENGVLLGIKNKCVKKKPQFLCQDGSRIEEDAFRIYSTLEEATQAAFKMNGNMPYIILDYGFYKVIYNDELKKTMDGKCDWNVDEGMPTGAFVTMGIPGIIKNKNGMCYRYGHEPYNKDWESEKEIRIKVGVHTSSKLLPEEAVIPRMALPLKDDIFDEIKIRFSPSMSEKIAQETFDVIKSKLPNSVIHILK